MGQPITIRPLRLTDDWKSIRASLQAWIQQIAALLAGDFRLTLNAYAEIATVTVQVGTTTYPVRQRLAKLTTPPVGAWVCKVMDRDAPQTPVNVPITAWQPSDTGEMLVYVDESSLTSGRTYLVSFFVVGA